MLTPRVVSTIFPRLPRNSSRAFYASLLLALGGVIGLAASGLFPIALVTAAFTVPLLMVLYALQADVFEDEPLLVLAVTAGFGLTAGLATGLVVAQALPRGAEVLTQSTEHELFWHGIVVPLVTTALALGGPLLLLRARRFNDVLDGTTFGVTSAVAFLAGEVVAESSALFANGLRPVGRVWPWVVRLAEIGFALPVIVGCAIGGACAAFWLRYRAPVRDRSALGVIGRPAAALVAAVALLIGASVAQLLLGRVTSLVVLIALAVIAVAWLRAAIHVGLMEEEREDQIGAPLICANCGGSTPRHTFCARCGISLLALPKSVVSS
jgi:hypothetical protein